MLTDWTSPLDRRHAVRFSCPDPDMLPSPAPAEEDFFDLDWRGPNHYLGFGVMAAPTVDNLLTMVNSGLPGLAARGLLPEFLIGATAAGAAALQGGSTRRLGAEDMVFLRRDEHVQAWVLSSSVDPLDLLIVPRPSADFVGPAAPPPPPPPPPPKPEGKPEEESREESGEESGRASGEESGEASREASGVESREE